MSIRLIITQGGELIADIPGYEGPVPRLGDVIHHPRGEEPVPGMYPDGVLIVKQSPSWGIMGRPRNGEGHFVGAAEPFVEVTV